MRIDLPLSSGITLMMASAPYGNLSFPTARIQKGLILIYEGRELCEEAVGFGVPILKRGLKATFPSSVEIFPIIDRQLSGIQARFTLDLEERIKASNKTTLDNPALYVGKNILAAAIRRLPFARGILTRLSSLLRSQMAWETTYEPSAYSTHVTMTYVMDATRDRIQVELNGMDIDSQGVSEVVVMNELGAGLFDMYQDSGGLSLVGNDIGCWDQVLANEATFLSHEAKIAFRLPKVDGARLYRGRELIGNRLAWAGFGYTFPPDLRQFSYEIVLTRLP